MRALRPLIAAVTVAFASVCVFVMVRRLSSPWPLEWMTGTVLDQVDRVRKGEPLYAAPTSEYIPYMYPPLYARVSAVVTRFVPGYPGCRLVSLASAFVQASCVYVMARRNGAARLWAVTGASLLFCAFRLVGYWYDVERSDTLFMALVTLSALTLGDARSSARTRVAGLILGVAFFAKQPALLFVAGVGAVLLLKVGFRRGLEFLSGACVVLAATVIAYGPTERFWFQYYVEGLGKAHGVDAGLLYTVIENDLRGGFVFLVACVWAFLSLMPQKLSVPKVRAETLHAAWAVSGFAAAVVGRFHVGGHVNVLGAWVPFSCVLVAEGAQKLEAHVANAKVDKSWFVVAFGGLLVQLHAWAFWPQSQLVGADVERGQRSLFAYVKELEAHGAEVLMPGLAHVTSRPHFHIAALADIPRAEGRTPAAVLADLYSRRFGAIVDALREPGDSRAPLWPAVMLEDIDDVAPVLLSNYFVAERLDDTWFRLVLPPPVFCHRWLLLPREHPLVGTPFEALRARRDKEMALASAWASAREHGEPTPFDPKDIEQLAGRP